MTTIFEIDVTCAACGATQTVQEMGSTSSFGAMDLDTRPPELRRSTTHLWVHECGECGYVAPELAAAGDLRTAGWRRLHAAWVCDDANAMEEARTQRRAALELFERARASGQRAMKSVEGGDEVLLADIARRAGEWERALAYGDAGLALTDVPAFVRGILEFERTLVLVRDTTCHNVGEVEASSDDTRERMH